MATQKDTAAPKPKILVDVTCERIRKDISEEFLKPGEKINVRVLSERYGVSETPIKQALNRLMMQGLVESIPHKGMKVKRISWPEIEEIMELRLMLELNYIPKVITALEHDLQLQKKFEENIQANIALVENFSNASEYFKTYEQDQQFHRLYLQCSGNQKAVQVFDNLNTHAYSTYLYNKQPRERTLAGVLEHRSIYEALLAKDENRVRALLTSHTQNAQEIIYLILKIDSRA